MKKMPFLTTTFRPASILFGFSIIFTFLLVSTYLITRERIEASTQAAQLERINEILPHELYNNILLNDKIMLEKKAIYRARQHGQPVAVLFEETAPDGYSGEIRLLIAIYADGRLAGVRVVQHRETPGLGDYIELAKSDWILQFTQRSLQNTPQKEQWHVKKDGGIYAYRAGATITPRAVIKAVHHALLFYQQHQAHIFDQAGITQ